MPTTLTNRISPLPRKHPKLAPVFKAAEARHFSDEELAVILSVYPDLKEQAQAAQAIRLHEGAIVENLLEEILSQYPFEKLYESPRIKLPRDWKYIIAYGVHAMVGVDIKWYDDKVLIWAKTILQSFNFPDRLPGASDALFSDEILEARLSELPAKCRAIYHTYYRIRQEYERVLPQSQASLFCPILEHAANVLTESY